MPELKLYHYPLRACSLVTFNALEEAGLEYEDQSVDILKGEQKSPDYLKVHPGGKVPALRVDDQVLTENAAILIYLDALAADANLLPTEGGMVGRAKGYSDLIWCSSTFHPAVRQVRMAMRFTDGDYSGVQAKGVEYVTAIFNQVEARVAGDKWWYGDDWSIVDVYICWCIITAASTGLLPMDKYPAIQSLLERVQARPSFQKAIARQIASKERDGIIFPDDQ